MVNAMNLFFIIFNLVLPIIFSVVFGQHFTVDISDTGESSLFIFQEAITSLEAGDELGLFDSNGIIDSNGNTGEILVGAGFWTGSQLEIVGIHGVDLSQFGGPILPGAGEGNPLTLKVWKAAEEMEYTVTYVVGTGSGSFDGLFTAIEEIYLVEPHFMVDIEETGESSLFIFQDSITSLEPLDQICFFDSHGIKDSNGKTGEIHVASGFSTG